MGNQEALEVSIKTDLDCVQNLVQYFQMETRSALRSTMSQIFGALCTMSPVFITNLFYSTLTLELVKDIMSVEGMFQHRAFFLLVIKCKNVIQFKTC